MQVPGLEKLEEALDWGGTRKNIAFLVISAISLLASFFAPDILPFDPAWIAIILCGLPIVLGAIIGLVTEFDIKADVLVSIALIAAVAIGENFAAGEVALIMQLGALLEELTVAKARAGIEHLVHLTPRTARIVENQVDHIVPAEEVKVGDILRVLPGETIAVDGTIVNGRTSIDESVMTGESLPVDKTTGDEVKSGTVNQFGAFEMRAERVGEDSSLARMISLVQSADAGKAKIVRLADRWATWIVVIALTAAAGTWLVTGEIIRAVTILVVFCPCALVLATPTAIMAAIGNVTKYGILVREGDALERLASVRKTAFDKTGTLTHGRPEVITVQASDNGFLNDETLYTLVASGESMSEHPIGKAVVNGWRKQLAAQPDPNAPTPPVPSAPHLQDPSSFDMIPGRGVRAVIEGREVVAGNAKLLLEEGVSGTEALETAARPFAEQGCTMVFAAVDGRPAGFVALADTVRPTARQTIAGIRRLGIEPVLLTGDHPQAARHIAQQVGIDTVEANCLPENKMAAIVESEQDSCPVCMVGDGINDAPALKRATVGIAMGGTGSDIAVDAADIALIRDDISSLPHLLALSKRMMTTIKLNMTFSLTLNFVAIALAMTGILDPVVGALVHNVGSVVVIVNSATLLRWKMSSKKIGLSNDSAPGHEPRDGSLMTPSSSLGKEAA